MTHPQPTVLVLDFGAQYAQLIARRVREARVFSEVVPHTITAAEIAQRKPAALILSGGPASVHVADAPQLDPAIVELNIPTLGLCYGFQALAQLLGGEVASAEAEYGKTTLTVRNGGGTLLHQIRDESQVWMSHRDRVTRLPETVQITASTPGAAIAAFEVTGRPIVGVQFHPEVHHTEHGQQILENFLFQVAHLSPTWTPAEIASEQIAALKAQIGDKRVLCGLSGGVDSAVAAALVQQAVGEQLTCVFVDHGLLRAGEREQVENDFVAATGVELVVRDERARFLDALAGVSDPETKRKIIGREFIRVFEDAARDIAADEGIDFLVQGTLYPDVVESGGGTGTATIKSHHNVGGLPDDLEFELVEPLRLLFKDEVRQVGLELGLPDEMVWRHPFPGPGLGIRIVGEITQERLDILRAVDAIVREETRLAGLEREIWQFPVVLLADVRSVGVQGDSRTYGYPIVLRPITSEDAMTADWYPLPTELLSHISRRITNQVPEVNRVVLDVTSKPPGTIEWE